MAYINSWVVGMQGTDYRPGVYCSFAQTAAQIRSSVGDIPVWAFHPIDSGPRTIDLSIESAPDPSNSGFGGALVWQYKMSLNGPITLRWTDQATGATKTLQTVDLDTAVCQDPSNPAFPTPVVNWVDPSAGEAGATVTVAGSDFDGVIDIAFGTVSAANMTVDSETQLSAIVPTGLAGSIVDVVVTNRWNLQSALGVQFSIT